MVLLAPRAVSAFHLEGGIHANISAAASEDCPDVFVCVEHGAAALTIGAVALVPHQIVTGLHINEFGVIALSRVHGPRGFVCRISCVQHRHHASSLIHALSHR